MARRLATVALMLALGLGSQGCAVPMTDGANGPSVNFTLDGIAYRTFGAPVDTLQRATLTTFKRMELALQSDEPKDDGCRELIAADADRTIHVELEKLTARTTRMRITAKRGWVWRDRATAGEFIVQAERALNDTPAFTQRTK